MAKDSHYDDAAIVLRNRCIATVLVLGCIAGPLLDLVHAASARHVACAEHGELEDVPAVAHTGEVARPEATCDRQPAPPVGHEHERCVVVVHGRQARCASTSKAAQPIALAPVNARPAPFDARPVSRIIVHRLAPKTSPPA